jgi:uncharacterized protein
VPKQSNHRAQGGAGALLGVGALAVAGAISSYWYGNQIEAQRLVVEQVALRIPRLDRAFDGYRIAQITDIHMDHKHMTMERLLGIASRVNAEKPDFIAVTGDFTTRGRAEVYSPSLVGALRALCAPDGVGGVLGNHDYWTNARIVRQTMISGGLIDLSNAVHTVTRGGSQLHLCGVDDIWENRQRLDRVLDALPKDGAAVLLAHEPDFADESAASGRFDLQLSGHSHGGQIVLPNGAKPGLPALGQKYPSGLYKVGEMWQYTNRGLGMTWFPQVRLNCPMEITVFTLRAG